MRPYRSFVMAESSEDMEEQDSGNEGRRCRIIAIVGTVGCEAADRWRLCRSCLAGGVMACLAWGGEK
jgi:hypothetical protein